MAGEIAGYTAHLQYKVSTSTASATTIARLTNVNLSATQDLIETTNRDSTGQWRTRVTGFRSWNGSAEFMFVDANATQEGLFSALNGNELTFTFYPGGSTGGGTNYSGAGFITSWDATAPDEEPVAQSIEFEGTKALSQST